MRLVASTPYTYRLDGGPMGRLQVTYVLAGGPMLVAQWAATPQTLDLI